LPSAFRQVALIMTRKKIQLRLTFLFLISFWECKNNNTPPRIALICTWPDYYYSAEVVEDYIAEVVFSEVALTQHDSIYVIRTTKKIGKLALGTLVPCNMPNGAKENNLNIKVSGHIVRSDGFDNALFVYGYPFEITSMEYLNK
jgi:hypothetical protein